MCTSRPPTAANCGSPDIPNPMPSCAYCSISSNSRCRRSRHPKSPPRRLLRNPAVVKTFELRARKLNDLNHPKCPNRPSQARTNWYPSYSDARSSHGGLLECGIVLRKPLIALEHVLPIHDRQEADLNPPT